VLERAKGAESRVDLWRGVVAEARVAAMAEIGVFRGEFAEALLGSCDSIRRYYLIDPWRHLDRWNKPANRDDATFERYYEETRRRTAFAGDRCVFLRGTTTEVVDGIADGELDFAYVDGDHTLRGITIDLVRIWPKIRDGGLLGGDDFSPTIWQHRTSFEPTLVFPFAVHFAEAQGARIHGLPFGQFLIEKPTQKGSQKGSGTFSFVDHTGKYADTALGAHLRPGKLLRRALRERFRR